MRYSRPKAKNSFLSSRLSVLANLWAFYGRLLSALMTLSFPFEEEAQLILYMLFYLMSKGTGRPLVLIAVVLVRRDMECMGLALI